MKKLTYEELLKAPPKVAFLYTMAMLNQPVGVSVFEEAIAEHPEYFPDEVEHRRKWSLIPQHVHDEYHKELTTLGAEIYKDMPPSKGFLEWVNDPSGYKKWSTLFKIYREKEKVLEAELHKKYYSKYGV